MYASEMVEISPGATVLCGVVHVPVAPDELCFVNAKAELGLLFNVFEQSNKDGVINSLSIAKKSKLPVTVRLGQQAGSLYLMETVKIPSNILNTSDSPTNTLNSFIEFCSPYFYVSYLFYFSFLLYSFSISRLDC